MERDRRATRRNTRTSGSVTIARIPKRGCSKLQGRVVRTASGRAVPARRRLGIFGRSDRLHCLLHRRPDALYLARSVGDRLRNRSHAGAVRQARPDVDEAKAQDPNWKSIARRHQCTADSARPETISYMKRHGYPRMQAAIKGPGSVEDGIVSEVVRHRASHPQCVRTRPTNFRCSRTRSTRKRERVTTVLEERKTTRSIAGAMRRGRAACCHFKP
jgi:hypothetical protein